MLQWARQSGCRWDAGACSLAAYGGHLAVLQWRDTMAAIEVRTPAPLPLPEATWQSCSGRDTVAAAGMRTPAPMPLPEATWQCYSGPVRTTAPGLVPQPLLQLSTTTLMS